MNQEKYSQFYVAVNVLVVQNKKLLLGMRKQGYGAGTWGVPGGHLEQGEEMKSGAARELKEETGLIAKELVFANVVNNARGDVHYVQIGFLVTETTGELRIAEPDRCAEWRWFDLGQLPSNIVPPHAAHIAAYMRGESLRED